GRVAVGQIDGAGAVRTGVKIGRNPQVVVENQPVGPSPHTQETALAALRDTGVVQDRKIDDRLIVRGVITADVDVFRTVIVEQVVARYRVFSADRHVVEAIVQRILLNHDPGGALVHITGGVNRHLVHAAQRAGAKRAVV